MNALSYRAADFSIDGKVILITGAGAGIGPAMAFGLADAGAKIVCIDRDEKSAADVADAIGRESALALACDVTKEDEVKSAVS